MVSISAVGLLGATLIAGIVGTTGEQGTSLVWSGNW